jgi:hypothetical protein
MASVLRTFCETMYFLWCLTFRTFFLLVIMDVLEKKDLFVLSYISSNTLLFLRQELKKTGISRSVLKGCFSCFNICNPLPSDRYFSLPQGLRFKQTFMNSGRVPIIKKETFNICCFDQLLTFCYLITNCVLSSVE